ncbi:MAG TPA: ADP-ribosylglycohydrolase family protein [Verrucomicrobiota bacterium]|nr:ADP-ribosylglycohydrolase family protein [Verrucomicrobiota bacterium]
MSLRGTASLPPAATCADRAAGALWGAFLGDALAMPVHWYYDRAALRRDYGEVRELLAPRNPHPDSILWRSRWEAPSPALDILHDQRAFWGRPGIHYHQHLAAGENTLNLQLVAELLASLAETGGHDVDDYARRYVAFLTTPGRHRDTYVEEVHRGFIKNLGRGRPPRECGIADIHIGGLAWVPPLAAWFPRDAGALAAAIREQVGLTHRAPEVLAAAVAFGEMLRRLIGGEPPRPVIRAVGETLPGVSIARLERWLAEPDLRVVGERLSPACYIGDAFPAALWFVLKYAGDPEAGLVANTMAGGDNCHRGVVVGALLGAAHGAAGWPARWLAGLAAHARLADLVARVGVRA